MKKVPVNKENRKHPRATITLPAMVQKNKKGGHPGLTLDVSESGMLVQTLKEIPVGTKLNIEIQLPGEFKLSNMEAEVEIIWKDAYYWEDLEGYQYGLKLTQISEANRAKYREFLKTCLD